MKRETILSDDRKFRYTLWREFYGVKALPGLGVPVKGNEAYHYANFICLNPSTADEKKDDPTIRRCIGFTKTWGFGAFCMTNLFAFRATKPVNMKLFDNPCGEQNQHYLLECASNAGIVIAAWGVHGVYHEQDLTVRQWLKQAEIKIYHLGLTKDGHPKHPLYLKADTKPTLYLL